MPLKKQHAEIDIRKSLSSKGILLLAVIAVLTIATGLISGAWLAAIVYVLAGLFGLFAGIGLSSQCVFPVYGRRARWQAFQVLLGWTLEKNRSSYIVRNGKKEERIHGHRSASLPGVILVDSCSAAVLTTDLSVSRVIGPGERSVQQNNPSIIHRDPSTYFSKRYETFKGVIDLHPQQLAQTQVSTLTRDGIALKFDLSIDFEIQRDPRKASRDCPYTFSNRSVYLAVYSEGVSEQQMQKHTWTSTLQTLAADNLRHIIAQHTLDQLLTSTQPDDIFAKIQHQITEALNTQVKNNGAQIIRSTLGAMVVPSDVLAQRVENWRSIWQKRKTIVEAQAESEAKRREETARALAQTEMITSIVSSLEDLGDEPAHEIITLRLIQVLELMNRDPLTRTRLSPNTLGAILAITPAKTTEMTNDNSTLQEQVL